MGAEFEAVLLNRFTEKLHRKLEHLLTRPDGLKKLSGASEHI